MQTSPFKAIALAAAVTMAAVAFAPQPAEARRAGAVIAGIAIGALVAGAIAHDRRHGYAHGAPAYAGPPPRGYYSRAPEPWTEEWYRYCHDRYRSFDPYSGTFQPYNGPRRLCR